MHLRTTEPRINLLSGSRFVLQDVSTPVHSASFARMATFLPADWTFTGGVAPHPVLVGSETAMLSYVADNSKYAADDVVEINRDGVPRKVTGTGSDGGGQYFTIDTGLGSASSTYTGAASTTFIENWGEGKTAGNLSRRDYRLEKGSECMDTGRTVDAGTYIYVDVDQDGSYDQGLDIIVRLNGYAPVSMNVPNPTGYDLVYERDVAGNRRYRGDDIDRGAYEYQPPRGTIVLLK